MLSKGYGYRDSEAVPFFKKMSPYAETRRGGVVSYCVMLTMALNIKDLHANSGNRLKKKNYR